MAQPGALTEMRLSPVYAGREGGRKGYDIPRAGGGGAEPCGKRRLSQGKESTTRISNETRPQDPGGGEVQLTTSRDMAVARPILQPTSQQASVMVVTEELTCDVWTCLESGVYFRGRDVIGVSGTFHAHGVPTNALRHVAEKWADFAGGGAVVVAPPAVFAGVVAADVATLTDAGMVTVGVADLADAGMAFPADLAGVIAVDVTTSADAGMVSVGVADLADAGMAFPADLAEVVAVDVAALANAGMVTVGMADLADAGTAFPADLDGVVAADVATLAVVVVVTVGVASPADAGAGTVGVSDLADAGMALNRPILLDWPP